MAAAHERDEDGGDEDGGAEHDQVVLEGHKHRRHCNREQQPGSELTHGSNRSDQGKSKRVVAVAYAMAGGW